MATCPFSCPFKHKFPGQRDIECCEKIRRCVQVGCSLMAPWQPVVSLVALITGEILYITSSSRASRGRKFQKKKKWCIARKEFAYRMRARRPTSAMPKPFLCCERAFCCSMVLMCRGGDLTSFDVMRSVAG